MFKETTKVLSLRVLIGAALIAAAVVMFWGGPASGATTEVEAERMTLPSGQGQVFLDGRASGGKGLLIWSDGVGGKTLSPTVKADGMVVRARGDQCFGAPNMIVRVNGARVFSETVPATGWTDYKVSLAAGTVVKSFGVGFNNDYAGRGCDRNLRVDRVGLVSAAPPTVPVTPTPSFGVNLAGGEFGGNLPGVYNQDYTYPSAAEMDYFKSKGLTVLRVPFRWERLQRTPGGPLNAEEMVRVDKVVADARSRGMRVVLDCHNYGRYKIGGTDEKVLGSPEVPNSAFADFWRKIADRYKNESAIYGYGLMNEPHDMGDDRRWPAAAQAATDAIRAVDGTHTVLVSGDHWSGAHSWRNSSNENLDIKDPANNVVYEAHQYFDNDHSGTYDKSYDGEGAYPNVGVDRARPFVEWLQAKGKKGFVGEFGVPGNDPRWNAALDNFLAYLKANNVSGTYWAAGPWWGDYPLSIEPTNNFATDKPQMTVLQKYP